MLEASAHRQLKALLLGEGAAERWPHHLTLSRLVARSLRRGDHTMVRLLPGTDLSWWIGLLVPMALTEAPLALVVRDALRQRLLQVEWPRLKGVGLSLPCWQGEKAPPHRQLWLLSHQELLQAWRNGTLGTHQLVIPEAEQLEDHLRRAMGIRLDPQDWDRLRRAQPQAEESLLELHQRLSKRILSHPAHGRQAVALAPEEEAPLHQLLAQLAPLPDPWDRWQEARGEGWCSWAQIDTDLLQWQGHRQPLAPLQELDGLLSGRGAILVGELAGTLKGQRPPASALALGLKAVVSVDLGDPSLSEPLPLYAPQRQPLPNSPQFAEHLLDHCRRLILGQAGLTIVLLDDTDLRRRLASGLAAEFGSRVGQESTAPESNGVICCTWSWWLENQGRLPHPCQLIVGLLPIASLEDPLTAAQVQALRRQGRDWFRELLLPDALNRLQRGLAGLRRQGGRLAVLDGRLRARSWGRQVYSSLEPWVQRNRLLPN